MPYFPLSSVRRILKRGGGQKFQKIWQEQRSKTEIVPPRSSPKFRPKSGEEQKKKGLHSNLVQIFAQNQVKSKNKAYKRSKAYRKRTEHSLCMIKPYAQLAEGGPCLNFAYFSMQFCNPGDPKGGAMAQWPPLNTPLFPLHGPNHPQLKFYTIMQDFKCVLEFNCK